MWREILLQARQRSIKQASLKGWLIALILAGIIAWAVIRLMARETVAIVRGAWWALRTVPALARLLLISASGAWLVHAVWYAIPLTTVSAGLLLWPRISAVSFRARMAGPAYAAKLKASWGRIAEACGLGVNAGTGWDQRPIIVTPKAIKSTASAEGVAVRLDVQTVPGQIPDDVVAAGPKIAAAAGAVDFLVAPTGPASAAVELVTVNVLGDTLPARLPALPGVQVEGVRVLPSAITVPETVTIGLTQTGTAWDLVTAAHTLTAGCTGSGKGSVMWSTLTALAPAIHAGTLRVAGVDLKGGMELALGRPLFTDLATTPETAVTLLERLAELMANRASRLAGIERCHTATVADPAWLVVIDEMAVLTAYLGDRDLRLRATRALSVLLTQGRAVGVTVWAFLQDPGKDVLTVRDLFTQRVCLRMTEPTAAVMVLGDTARTNAPAHQIPAGSPGVGYALAESGHVQRVRASYVTDDHIRTLAERFPAPVDGVVISEPAPRADTEGQVPPTTNTGSESGRRPRAPRTPRTPRAPRAPRAPRSDRGVA